jgi:hypothetical protein
MSDINYYEKYLKYKNKYLELKNQEGGIGETKYSYGIGYMLMTTAELTNFKTNFPRNTDLPNNTELVKKTELLAIKKVIKKFNLTNLKTLKNIDYKNIIETKTKTKTKTIDDDPFSNSIKDMTFIKGTNEKLNQQIKQEIKQKDKLKKTKLVIFTLEMPYLVYTDINSSINILHSYFVIPLT